MEQVQGMAQDDNSKEIQISLANTNVINKMTSPPPSPSPLEGEGRVGGKII